MPSDLPEENKSKLPSTVPDTVSTALLRALSASPDTKKDGGPKATKREFDFNNPVISDNIGDLAFAVTAYVKHILETNRNKVNAEQLIFMTDNIVTNARCMVEQSVKEASKREIVKSQLLDLSTLGTRLLVAEQTLDHGIQSIMESKSQYRDTKPSYRLLRSFGIEIQANEVSAWLGRYRQQQEQRRESGDDQSPEDDGKQAV